MIAAATSLLWLAGFLDELSLGLNKCHFGEATKIVRSGVTPASALAGIIDLTRIRKTKDLQMMAPVPQVLVVEAI
jgi:hypothetical protein